MRRISFFNDPDIKHTNLYKAFRRIKKEMINFNGDFNGLLMALRELCAQLNLNADQIIKTTQAYSEADKKHASTQCALLYEALIKQRLFSLFNIQESGWHPKDGFAGLKESLKTHGAHAFIGKFGAWCHRNQVSSYSKKNTHNREVYAFQKGSYAGDATPWTHTVVVDQVKIVNGTEMIFFRDPYDTSSVSNNEKIYALSYENFLRRLTNHQSQRSWNECQYEKSFGIVSSNPSNLLKT